MIGFDIERHVYGEHRYPGQLVIQDVLTLHAKKDDDMSKKSKMPKWQDGPYECYFMCGAVLLSKFTIEARALGWEWFTGYGKDTVNICPQCADSRRVEIASMKEQLNIKPAGYPKEFAAIKPL